MVHSMTAFARVESAGTQGTLSWELRSVNSRYLEPHLRLPESFRDLEGAVREALRQGISRGKLECTLRFTEESTGKPLQVDRERAAQLVAAAETIASLMAGELDDQLVYRKRLRRPLAEYQRNVPPHVRAARLADEENVRLGRAPQYQSRGIIKYVWTTSGPEPVDYQQSPLDYDHYLTKQLQPVAEGILPFVNDDFATIVTGQLGLF